VVVATCATPFKPPIPAVESPNVHQAWDVLKGNAATGADVVVVGGGSVGLETALSLATKGTISPSNCISSHSTTQNRPKSFVNLW